MPWITEKDRVPLETGINDLASRLTHENAGDITYTLYEIIIRIWARKKRWTTACILIGALVGALLCFFMKHVWKYEVEKMKENGETIGDLS